MRRKLAAAVVAAAFVAAPVAAVPAQASETHICSAFAYPYDQPCWIVMGVVCRRPVPPLTICR
ncbi:MAG: hypothetical protein M3279_06905 [Actinomycetota bacterium]|nr:hypothetical protein [Actinomycetota bacterium]